MLPFGVQPSQTLYSLRQTIDSTQLASVHFVSSTRWVAGLKRNTGLIKLYTLAQYHYYEDVSEDVDPREKFYLKYVVENKN